MFELLVTIPYLIFAIYVLCHTKKMIYLCMFSFLIGAFGHTFSLSFVILNIFGITLYSGDILVALMMVCLFLKRKNLQKNKMTVYIVLLFMIVSYSMISGCRVHGFSSEFFGDVRKFFYYVMPILYFYMVGLEEPVQKVLLYVDKMMNFLAIYCFIAWFFYMIGLPITPTITMRVLASNYAIIIVVYTLYLIYSELFILPKRKISMRTVVFFVMILILQHNSTWVAFVGGLSVMIILNCRSIIMKHQKIIIQFALIGLLGIILITVFQKTELVQTIMQTFDKFQDIENETGTFGTRITLWHSLLDTINGYEWIIGKPFGEGYYVIYRGKPWEASPHNGYIEGLLRIGLFGMIFLLIIVFCIIARDISKYKTCIVSMILVAFLIYWIPYSFTFEAGIFVGIAANEFYVKRRCDK